MGHKILVTGGAGYIGSILVQELLADGHDVTVVDDFRYDQNSLAHVCSNERFHVVRGDVRDEELMKKLLVGADFIFPLAALVGAPLCARDPNGAKTINHEAVAMMLKHTSASQAVIMPTTNSAYGTSLDGSVCDENSPLNPISRYAKDKVLVEALLMEKENAISFRLATVFGMSPRMRIDLLVNDFTYRAVKDRFVVLFESHFKRNYIHIRDVCDAFRHGLKNFEGMKGNIFNVGLSDANLSKYELCELIQKRVPDFVFIDANVGKDPDQRNYIVSNEKIEATGFRPRYSLDAGIKELIKGYAMISNAKYGNV